MGLIRIFGMTKLFSWDKKACNNCHSNHVNQCQQCNCTGPWCWTFGTNLSSLACALRSENLPLGHFMPMGTFLSHRAQANIFQLGPQAKCLGPHSAETISVCHQAQLTCRDTPEQQANFLNIGVQWIIVLMPRLSISQSWTANAIAETLLQCADCMQNEIMLWKLHFLQDQNQLSNVQFCLRSTLDVCMLHL